MNDPGTKCYLMEAILRKSGKARVCPVCDIPYVDAKHVLKHCRDKAVQDEKDNVHKGIGCVNTNHDFDNFLSSIREAIGWSEMPEKELPLTRRGTGPPAYGDCLKIRWIVDKKARSDSSEKLILLEKIVLMAKIHHVCPACLRGFPTGKSVLQHCGDVDDEIHKGLASKNQTTFLEFYEKAMGRTIPPSEVSIYYDRAGNPGFENCFGVGHTLQYKCKAPINDIAMNRCWMIKKRGKV